VVLDLRRNGGGSLEEAIKLTGLFIKSGPVVQVKNSEGDIYVDEDNDPGVVYDGPLVVLTSRFSASASEILAGALQDYGRALVVGDQSTHGKGTVQNLNPLRGFPGLAAAGYDPGQLKITIRKFYRASGASTQKKGVLPDIVLPSVLNQSEDIGEAALDTALPWDVIKSARYEKLNQVDPYLGELLQRSASRVATNQDYVYIREDIEQFRKIQNDKTVSLNEAERLKEKEEAEARQKAREKERLARKDSDRTTYELTLKQVDLPGLPAPVQKTNHSVTLAPTSGSGTNLASVTAAVPRTPESLDDADAEEAAPVADAMLEETEQILMDYISLLNKKGLAAAKPTARTSRPD
jgi:carboxyl-terminal processing protease